MPKRNPQTHPDVIEILSDDDTPPPITQPTQDSANVTHEPTSPLPQSPVCESPKTPNPNPNASPVCEPSPYIPKATNETPVKPVLESTVVDDYDFDPLLDSVMNGTYESRATDDVVDKGKGKLMMRM